MFGVLETFKGECKEKKLKIKRNKKIHIKPINYFFYITSNFKFWFFNINIKWFFYIWLYYESYKKKSGNLGDVWFFLLNSK